MTDFEEFARLFRARTIARMEEFEKNLEKAQADVEKAASQQARSQHKKEKHTSTRTNARVQGVLRRNSPF